MRSTAQLVLYLFLFAQQSRAEGVLSRAGNVCSRFYEKVSFALKKQAELEQNRVLVDPLGNYFSIKFEEDEKIKAWNSHLLDALGSEPKVTVRTGKKAGLSKEEIKALFKAVAEHPVASRCKLDIYDPKGENGFCFGRAMTVHLEAILAGLDKDSVKKIWAVGSIVGKEKWKFHVAAMVKSVDGSWYVVDPVLRMPVKASTWYLLMQYIVFRAPVQLFASHASRWSPFSNEKVRKTYLLWSGYNGYFSDLLAETRRRTNKARSKRN